MNFDNIIDEISQKYNYSNDLTVALKRCVPSMLKGKSKPEVQLLIDTLKRVEIYTFDEQPTLEQINEIEAKKLNGRNDHVIMQYLDMGEYGNSVGDGAYSTVPIFDKEMNIIDRVGFIHLTNLSEKSETAQFYGSTINYSYLIHELGHAVAAQEGEYVQNENGNYTCNVGTASRYNEVDKEHCKVNEVSVKGIYTEEALNTIDEEKALCDVFGIESVKKIPGYNKSKYQGTMSDVMKSYVEKIGYLPFSKLRILKDNTDLLPYMQIISKTDFAQSLTKPEYYEKKRKVYDEILDLDDVTEKSKKSTRQFFDKYEDVYFNPNISGDFISRLDNTLEQLYNFDTVKFKFNILGEEKNKRIYGTVVSQMLQEAYTPLEQATLEIEEYNNEKNKVSMKSLAKQAIICNPQRQEFEDCLIQEPDKEISKEQGMVRK